MKTILRATVLLSSSSVISILISLVAAKAYALLIGVSGVATMGLLQGLAALVGMWAGLGISSGLVREGAGAIERGDSVWLRALVGAAWVWSWLLGSLAVGLLLVFHRPIALTMLGGEDPSAVALMAASLVFSLANSIYLGMLNAHHRIGALARIGVLNTLTSTLASLSLIVWLGLDGIALSIVAGAILNWAVTRAAARRELPALGGPVSAAELARAAVILLRFGLPFTLSQFVGTGIQAVLPVLVLNMLGRDSVGYYRAAMGIAGGYLGFLIVAMGQDYYPRLAAVRDAPGKMADLVNLQHRLVLLMAAPLILGLLALAPILVPLLYTDEFTPAVAVLEWLLAADLLKFASWAIGMVILARCSSSMLLAVEVFTGCNLLVTSWLLVSSLGLVGIGIAFLITYMVHYLVVWLIVRREIGLRISEQNRRMLAILLLAVVLILALPVARVGQLGAILAFAITVVTGAYSGLSLWREVSVVSGGDEVVPQEAAT